jgi:HSP20 family protein
MLTNYFRPFKSRGSIENEIENLAHRCFGSEITTGPIAGEWLQPLEVNESESEMVYTAELPGFNPEDIEILIDENFLTIRVERNGQQTTVNANHHLMGEKDYGSARYTVKLSTEMLVNYISAKFEENIVTIKIPKRKKTIHRKMTLKPDSSMQFKPVRCDTNWDEFGLDDYSLLDILGWSI